MQPQIANRAAPHRFLYAAGPCLLLVVLGCEFLWLTRHVFPHTTFAGLLSILPPIGASAMSLAVFVCFLPRWLARRSSRYARSLYAIGLASGAWLWWTGYTFARNLARHLDSSPQPEMLAWSSWLYIGVKFAYFLKVHWYQPIGPSLSRFAIMLRATAGR